MWFPMCDGKPKRKFDIGKQEEKNTLALEQVHGRRVLVRSKCAIVHKCLYGGVAWRHVFGGRMGRLEIEREVSQRQQ